MRQIAPADHPATAAFLREHLAGSMFPLVNLAGNGVAMRGWWGQGGFVGLTDTGMVLPQLPGGDFRTAAACLNGQAVTGVLGPLGQVRPLIAAMGLAEVPARHDKDEPGFALDLADLVLPATEGTIIAPGASERALLESWRAMYLAEVFGAPPAEAAETAARDVAGWIARGSHRLLIAGNQPRAVTGFNAILPDVVQVGGVFTPPDQRGRGWARGALALHLVQAQARGARRAVLFAATPAAERAYRALGFQPSGGMTLVLFRQPQVVRCP